MIWKGWGFHSICGAVSPPTLLVALNSEHSVSAERQEGLNYLPLATQLDPFTSNLTVCLF